MEQAEPIEHLRPETNHCYAAQDSYLLHVRTLSDHNQRHHDNNVSQDLDLIGTQRDIRPKAFVKCLENLDQDLMQCKNEEYYPEYLLKLILIVTAIVVGKVYANLIPDAAIEVFGREQTLWVVEIRDYKVYQEGNKGVLHNQRALLFPEGLEDCIHEKRAVQAR